MRSLSFLRVSRGFFDWWKNFSRVLLFIYNFLGSFLALVILRFLIFLYFCVFRLIWAWTAFLFAIVSRSAFFFFFAFKRFFFLKRFNISYLFCTFISFTFTIEVHLDGLYIVLRSREKYVFFFFVIFYKQLNAKFFPRPSASPLCCFQ